MSSSLEKYYPGDRSWEVFVQASRSQLGGDAPPHDLVRPLGGDSSIAEVVYAMERQMAIAWIDKKIPALDGLSPRECANSETLNLRLRTMLMRMPG